MSIRCGVHGHEAHSSRTPYGVNAVEAAAELIARIKAIAPAACATRGRSTTRSTRPIPPSIAARFWAARRRTSCPPRCNFTYRDPQPARSRPGRLWWPRSNAMRASISSLRCTQSIPRHGLHHRAPQRVAGLRDFAEDHPTVAMVKSALGANAVGKVSYMTEAGLFGRAGIPTVICGPGRHRPGA